MDASAAANSEQTSSPEPLPTVIALEGIDTRSLLEENKALMERKTPAPADQSVVEGKRVGKFTSAQLAAIRNVVHQEQQTAVSNSGSEFVLLKYRLDAAEARMRKAEDENSALQKEIKFLKSKTECGITMWALDEEMREMKGRMAKAETTSSAQTSSLAHVQKQCRLHDCWSTSGRIYKAELEIEKVRHGLMKDVGELAEQVKALKVRADLASHCYETGPSDARQTLEDLLDEVDAMTYPEFFKLMRRLAPHIARTDLPRRVCATETRISEIEESLELHSCDIGSPEAKVGGFRGRAVDRTSKEINTISSKLGQANKEIASTND